MLENLNNANIVHMKRAFIIHGWGGNPEEGWFPWAKKELEKKGFEVYVPTMPDAYGKKQPQIEPRINAIKESVGVPDENTYFIGHSIGCQSIDRYLETLPPETKIGGVVYVAGWLTLKGLDDYEKNDPFVDVGNAEFFREKLGSETIVLESGGHLNDESNTKKLPEVIRAIEKLSV